MTILVTESQFKSITPTSWNVQHSAVKTMILNAQELYIRPLLCDKFYEEIIDQVKNSTLTVANKKILDEYISKIVAWYGLYHYLPFNWARIREQGLVLQNGDTASPVGLEDLTYVREEVRKTAESYVAQLRKFLCENAKDYPNFDCGCCGKPKTNLRFWVV